MVKSWQVGLINGISSLCLPFFFFHFLVILDSGKYHECMLKVLGKSLLENRIFTQFQNIILHSITENLTSQWKNLADATSTRVPRLTTLKLGESDDQVLPDMMHMDSNEVKMYIQNLILRKYHMNPKEGTFHKAGCSLQECQCCGCLSMLPFLLSAVGIFTFRNFRLIAVFYSYKEHVMNAFLHLSFIS